MKRVSVIINTYKRHAMLERLLSEIALCSLGYIVDVFVQDDGGDLPPIDVAMPENVKLSIRRHRYNKGKAGYWQLVNYAFSRLRLAKYDYVVMLPDDVTLAKDFFTQAISKWERIADPKKICLSLLLDKGREGKRCWTNEQPRVVLFGEQKYWKTQWNDLCFIAGPKFISALGGRIKNIPASASSQNGKSSGVGKQVTARLNAKGFSLYHVTETLVFHGDHESVMHKEFRKTNPIIT